MNDNYYIDPYIVSILFQQNDVVEILDTYRELLDKQGQLFDLTLKNYLLEKNIPIEQIDQLLDFENSRQPSKEISELLDSEEFKNKLQSNTESLIKAYYDVLLPELTEEKRKELESYIQEYKIMLAEQGRVVNKGISLFVELFEKVGVSSYNQLVKKNEYGLLVDEYLKQTQSITNDKKSKFDTMVLEYLNTLENSSDE